MQSLVLRALSSPDTLALIFVVVAPIEDTLNMFRKLLRVLSNDSWLRLTSFYLGRMLASIVVTQLLRQDSHYIHGPSSGHFGQQANHGKTGEDPRPFTSSNNEAAQRLGTVQHGELWRKFVTSMGDHCPSYGSMTVQQEFNEIPALIDIVKWASGQLMPASRMSCSTRKI